jgi:hypothetical protein
MTEQEEDFDPKELYNAVIFFHDGETQRIEGITLDALELVYSGLGQDSTRFWYITPEKEVHAVAVGRIRNIVARPAKEDGD